MWSQDNIGVGRKLVRNANSQDHSRTVESETWEMVPANYDTADEAQPTMKVEMETNESAMT